LAAPVEEKTVLTKEEQVTTEKEEKGVSRQEVSGREIVEVKSPMVGVFYSAPEPDAPPFVQVGTRVQKGQTLGIIEAMKLMNEITSEISGRVVKILVENSQPVEYGQVLFHIEKE
jgi:oxaloacetate decarboxylase alpha subunit